MSLQKERLIKLGKAIDDFDASMKEIITISLGFLNNTEDSTDSQFGLHVISFMADAHLTVMRESSPIFSVGFIIREYLKEYESVKNKTVDEMKAWINLKALRQMNNHFNSTYGIVPSENTEYGSPPIEEVD